MAEFVLRPLSVGEILDRAFTLFRRRFGTLVLITLICTAIPLLMALRWFGEFSKTATAGDLTGFTEMVQGMGSLLLLGLIMFIAITIANTAIVFVISETYLGRRIGVGESLRRTVRLLVQVVLLALLQQVIIVAVGIGLSIPIGLLVPASSSGSPVVAFVLVVVYFGVQVYLLASFFVALPALALEPGVNAASALGRAWSLATGNRWRIIGVLCVFMVIIIVIFFGVLFVGGGLASGVFSGGSSTKAAGIGIIITTGVMGLLYIISFVMVYCLQTVIYYDLRVRKEGFDLELLEASMGSM